MLSHLKSRFVLWRTYRQTVHELSVLDRQVLVDIGLKQPTRSAIKTLARQASRDAAVP